MWCVSTHVLQRAQCGHLLVIKKKKGGVLLISLSLRQLESKHQGYRSRLHMFFFLPPYFFCHILERNSQRKREKGRQKEPGLAS